MGPSLTARARRAAPSPPVYRAPVALPPASHGRPYGVETMTRREALAWLTVLGAFVGLLALAFAEPIAAAF